jgi:predicted AlkP superfamily pyrophosphatase or phosphodiesterase
VRRITVLAALLWGCALAAQAPHRDGTARPPEIRAVVEPGRRNAPAQREKPTVVLVSLDGFRPDYVASVPAPRLARMRREGASAPHMLPVFPSKTFPNHYSIATGMYAGTHGLVGNQMWDPVLRAAFAVGDSASETDPRWWGGEPLWVTAERQGMLSAALYWPGSQVPIGGVRPTYWARYDAAVPAEARVDQVLAWLRLPAERRPHFVAMYLSDVDAGHHAPGAPEVRAAVRRVDAAIGRLLDGVAALPPSMRVSVVVVSDHGMADVRPGRVFYLSDHVPMEGVRAVGSGPNSHLFFEGDTAALERTRAALRAVLPGAGVYRRDEIPARYRLRASPRAGDLLVEVPPPHSVVPRRPAPGAAPYAPSPGNHGYDPLHPSMHALFVAQGPAFRPGARVAPFENVHLYPALARILGLRPARGVEGRAEVLRGIVR